MNTSDRSLPYGGGHDRYLPMVPANMLPYDFAYQEREEEDDGIDLRSIWAAIYRNRYLILAIVALSLIVGAASVLLMPPTYRAKASVEIDQRSTRVLGTEDPDPSVSGTEMDRFLQTQIDILKSRAQASRVADSLQLAANDDFLRAMGKTPVVGEAERVKRAKVVSALQSGLDVALPRTSRVVDINFESRRPDVAARIANSYADNFISGNLQRRFDTSAYSRSFLQNQLGLTKGRLEQSERALIAYSRSAGLIDASTGAAQPGDGSGPRSLTTANLVQLNAAYSTARSQRVQAQQRWQQAQATPLMNLPEVLSNPAIQNLTQQRAQLDAAYQQQLQRRKREHPEVQQAAAQIKELDRQITALAEGIRSSIRDQYLTAQRQEGALRGNVGQLKGETLSEQDRGVRYNILKREVDTNRELYDGLLQRYKEISAQAGITSNNISVVDRAEPPGSPVSPRPVINMTIAGLAGLVLALLLVFAREIFDDALRAPEDVDYKLGLPLLGIAPRLRRRAVAARELLNPRSALSEGYHAIGASVQLSSGDGAPASLLVTSSRSGEGKSTSALAIARDFAIAGKQVLLIDADLRNPSLHATLGLPNRAGLSNVLAQHRNVDEVVQPTNTPGMSFLASGPLPPNPAGLLASSNFVNLLAALRDRFDHVVIDSPPVLGLADAPQLAAAADGTILVVEANRAHRGAAKAALRRLLRARSNVLGAILSKFDPRKIGQREYYDGAYYRYGSQKIADEVNAEPILDAPVKV